MKNSKFILGNGVPNSVNLQIFKLFKLFKFQNYEIWNAVSDAAKYEVIKLLQFTSARRVGNIDQTFKFRDTPE